VLVLTRKIGEGIAIGDDVKIIVMQIKGKQVRLGIKASPNTVVHREEVYQRIQDENKSAAEAEPSSVSQVTGIFGENDSEAKRPVIRRYARPKKEDE